MKRGHNLPDVSVLMMRNIVCAILVLCVAELNLSSGKHVKDVVIDQSDDVIDQTGVVVDPPGVAFDPPDVVIDQPGVVTDPKEVVIDRRDVGIYQPDVAINQTDIVIDPPEVANNQAYDVNDQRYFKDELPVPTEHGESEVINDNTVSLSRKKRKAIKYASMRWPQDEIPFEIDDGQFNNEAVNLIYQAMNVWQHYTCLRFRPRSNNDRNYIKIINGNGCYSDVGMKGGSQKVSLNTVSCMNLNFITHELGHAIGFFHEQNRPDRDQFVTIIMENVEEKYRYTYEISPYIDTYGVPYDYKSLMHYGGYGENGKITIQTKDPSFQNIIGNANGPSFNDIKLANLMYRCNRKCLVPLGCQNFGFQGQDCQCWCEGNPIQRCQ